MLAPIEWRVFFARTLSDIPIKLSPESFLSRTPGMVSTSVLNSQYELGGSQVILGGFVGSNIWITVVIP